MPKVWLRIKHWTGGSFFKDTWAPDVPADVSGNPAIDISSEIPSDQDPLSADHGRPAGQFCRVEVSEADATMLREKGYLTEEADVPVRDRALVEVDTCPVEAETSFRPKAGAEMVMNRIASWGADRALKQEALLRLTHRGLRIKDAEEIAREHGLLDEA